MTSPPLHITPDLDLDLSDPHSLTLRYPGDVHLSQTFGRPLAGAQVGGDLTLDLPEVTGTCVAQGVIRSASRVDAIRLTARELHLSGTEIRARALSATERIVIGPCVLKVDVIIAPVVLIHPEASGRVTVVESRNEQGPTKIRGEFTLQEYEENFGGAKEFLTGRGVHPLDKVVDVHEILRRPDVDLPHPAPILDEPEELEPEALEFVEIEPLDETGDDDSFDGVSALHPSAAAFFHDAPAVPDQPATDDTEDGYDPAEDGYDPATEISALTSDEAFDDALSDEDAGIIEPARPLPPRAPTPEPPPERVADGDPVSRAWFRRLDGLVEGIEAAYSDPPEAILTLRDLVDSRQAQRIEHDLDAVWTDTVRHHRQSRLPVDPRVAHRFRVLSDLMAQRPGT